MKNLFVFLGFLIMTTTALALDSKGKVHFNVNKSTLICDVDFGFHYNTKAPLSLEVRGKSLQPTKKEEKTLEFNLSLAQDDVFKVHFYVCDDALTICEPHEYTMRVYDKHLTILASNENAAPPKAPATPQSQKKFTPNENGFFEDQFEQALATAKKDHKLLLVDFRAPWCPACLRLETETFNQKTFEKASAKFVKVSLNIDLPENKEISEKYSVKAIPTMIIMNSDQEELYRSLDFKTAATFAGEFSKLPQTTDHELLKQAYLGNQKAIAALVRKNLDSMKFQEVLEYFHKLKSPSQSQKLMAANAEIGLIAESDDLKKKIEKYKTEIRDFSETYESIVWRTELAQIYADESPKNPELSELLKTNMTLIDKLLDQPKLMQKVFAESFQGDFSKFERAELLSQKIEDLKILDDPTKLVKTRQELASDIHARKLSTDRAGELLMAVGYLKVCDEKAEVISWLEKLIEKNPESFVYYAKIGGYYHEIKQEDKALTAVQRALVLSHEREFLNLRLLAQVQKALNKKSEAIVTISKALALPEAKIEKYKKYAKGLAEMQKTLSQ